MDKRTHEQRMDGRLDFMGRIKDYAVVKQAIDRQFKRYALYDNKCYAEQEFIYGRLTAMLYIAVVSGAITTEEFHFVDNARIEISLKRHKY